MGALGPCPICKLDQQQIGGDDYGRRHSVNCARCGKFIITSMAARMAESRQFGSKLSAWLRDRTESGAENPEINSKTLEEIEKTLPDYKVSDKQLLLLRALERRTKFPGEAVVVEIRNDYPLAWASGEEELIYLLRSLRDRDLIHRTDGPPTFTPVPTYKVQITPAGWSFLDERARTAAISDQAFVAMSFADELKLAWENGIRPALRRAGFNPYRVDAQPHVERIDTKIITEIKNPRFLVADVTLQRPGVYFEAGYALGLGLPVFWSVRKDDLANVHFDTRQYNHIVWETEQQLEEQLHLFVAAIIGKR